LKEKTLDGKKRRMGKTPTGTGHKVEDKKKTLTGTKRQKIRNADWKKRRLTKRQLEKNVEWKKRRQWAGKL
jgi:hypothetical protein